MSEPMLSMSIDDDLPRTLRRERDARERAAREREASAISTMSATEHADFEPMAPAATVTGIDMPFGKLVAFFLKAAVAAIPAILLLTVFLWLFGQALQTFFPSLLKLKILIYMP
jgi:hypothetical protein